MSQLPKGWESIALSELAKFIDYRGKTPKKTESGIPLITAKNIKDGYINREPREYIAEANYDEWMTRGIPQVGDVLLTTEAPLGNAAQIDIHEKFALAQRAICFQFHERSISRFAYYFLRSPLFKEELGLNATGSTVKGIKAATLKKLEVNIPPLAEQTRIVEKLDEVLAQVDTIKARLDGIPAILKRFRQSVLAAAVSGKLTEEWRGSHPALDSTHEVANIIESRKAIVAKRMQVPQEHLKNEEYPIPDSWTWTSLDALSSKIVDGVHHKPEYVDEGIPFMSVKDINGGKLSFDNCKYISQVTHEEIHPRCNPCRGDLLITKSGTIGRTAIIKTDDIFDLFVSVALIKPASSLVNMEFINIALMHWVNSIDVSSRVVGTAIKNLHLRDMRVLAVPFAPLEEQKEIVRLVDQYFAFADTIETQVKKAQARVDKLTQSILAKAFRGELVPQDPNDEPADKLLERIALARKEAEVLAKAAKKTAKK
ncbi:restriction endonuclease subunit S [Vibrio cholerae]|uniref:restriction endonuclease subunit S n=1 Tax=Vibrio cholerae TaxID=666 RepID=UPI00396716AB